MSFRRPRRKQIRKARLLMTDRVNMTIDDDMRDRFEAWRAEQYRQTGRIPSLADAARILVHKGLVAEGFKTKPKP